ncbi:hypothetical protein ABB37_05836 [Leptomonas pyrrhocoris]|uniref:Uncharacterized protein n=1 Tax=Leptomonas pyrrhocoris TaxID=157538 RepID=A0A0N0VEL6_LEPPY|nr:hypothetical protein ABB37_05836 [Leptomonas pyrrhocoris]KPA78702.1 hypothetical protein ABB37_05836 [Leptomonas pyrrhocoris]|eukprot:XP_015657141.1 hypothetical protein ABB37_05836 [Leptomonas pyrrhocoris]
MPHENYRFLVGREGKIYKNISGLLFFSILLFWCCGFLTSPAWAYADNALSRRGSFPFCLFGIWRSVVLFSFRVTLCAAVLSLVRTHSTYLFPQRSTQFLKLKMKEKVRVLRRTAPFVSETDW